MQHAACPAPMYLHTYTCCCLLWMDAQVPVLRPSFRETTSLGAALAAGLAVGFWSMDDIFAGEGLHVRRYSSGIVRGQIAVRAPALAARCESAVSEAKW